MPLTLNKDVSIRTINDESFIYDRHTSEIHTLNKTGSLILDLLSKNVDIDNIAQEIHEKFEIDLKSAQNDAKKFIDELIKKKVLINSEASNSQN